MLSVVIPTYKNKIQLLNNLKSNIRFLEKEQIIIVNDNPKESLKADLNIYKNVILIENSKNFGFGLSINIGVEKAKTKYIMLLNDDVLLLNTDFEKNLNSFKSNTDLFAISFAQKEITGEIIGKNKFFWHNGLFFHQRSDNLKYGLNAWAEGGACIIDKEKFKELKGFDLLFAPFYWEDIDLSYRAWKIGYKIIFNPEIIVNHHHESTIGKYFPKTYIKTVSFKNQFIFIWKNITDTNLILIHIFLIPFNLLYYLIIKREIYLIKGFFSAFQKITEILKKRDEIKKNSKLTDITIINLLKHG